MVFPELKVQMNSLELAANESYIECERLLLAPVLSSSLLHAKRNTKLMCRKNHKDCFFSFKLKFT